MSSSIYRLYQSHYKVRSHILACLKERVSRSSTPTIALHHEAFELSICYTLGFGAHKDDDKAKTLLEQAGSSLEDLAHEVNLVQNCQLERSPREGPYNSALHQGQVGLTTGGQQYAEDLKSASLRIKTEIVSLEEAIGASHRIVVILKSTLTNVLILQEEWEEAKHMQVDVLEWTSRRLGSSHPDTIWSLSNLAYIYSKQRRWNEAELLQTHAMIAGLSWGLYYRTTLRSMHLLAWNFQHQGKWDKAARLGEHVQEIREEFFDSEDPSNIDISDTMKSFSEEKDMWKRVEVNSLQVTITGLRPAKYGG